MMGKIYGNHGASWFGITAYGVDTVGLFDENIYPAYLEDCDWARRADLLGVRRCDVPDVHAIHGDENLTGSCTVNENPELAARNSRTHGGNFDYYRRKWGGLNGTETFATPFNDPHWPVWAARELEHPDPFGLVPEDWAWWLRNFRAHPSCIGWPAPAPADIDPALRATA